MQRLHGRQAEGPPTAAARKGTRVSVGPASRISPRSCRAQPCPVRRSTLSEADPRRASRSVRVSLSPTPFLRSPNPGSLDVVDRSTQAAAIDEQRQWGRGLAGTARDSPRAGLAQRRAQWPICIGSPWAGAATACRLLSGGMVRGAHCRLTPEAAVLVSTPARPPWCLQLPDLQLAARATIGPIRLRRGACALVATSRADGERASRPGLLSRRASDAPYLAPVRRSTQTEPQTLRARGREVGTPRSASKPATTGSVADLAAMPCFSASTFASHRETVVRNYPCSSWK